MIENRLAQLTEEYLALVRSGAPGTPETFAAAHPEFEAELLEMLPLLAAMEELSRTQPCELRPAQLHHFPERLGEFQLLEKLGSGGMGTVFRALQGSLNREVAVKILSPLWADAPELVQKFENESRVIAALHHPHIVQVFGAGREGEFSFYVMELIEGRSLDIKAERPPHEVARLGLQAAEALAFAHRHHVLHRDVKPANFLVDGNLDLHISDFGLATMLNENNLAMTQSRDGTLRYMAPERLFRDENSCASDQYSLGATLYELLARRPIFADAAPGAVLKHIEQHEIGSLEKIPRDLAAIVEKSLAFSPRDRYPGMQEMADDLKRFLQGEPVRARRCGVVRRGILWAKRRPGIAMLSLLVGVLALGLVTALVVGYVQTRRALSIADRTLFEIFSAYADQPGARNTALLIRLLPYYEAVAAERKIYANAVIGAIALRGGQAAIAERAFRHTPDRFRLAESLAMQGKTREAEQIWRELAAGKDMTAVRSLRALGGALRSLPGKEQISGGDPALVTQAWELLAELRRANPNDPEMRYLAAAILAENPRLGHGESAMALLKTLVEEYPQHPAYRLLLLRLAGKINPRNPEFDAQIRFALKQADVLLTHHPFEPEVLATAADVRIKHAAELARQGKNAEAVSELERACGLYQTISRHPDAPRDGAEKLQALEARLDGIKRKMEKMHK